MRWILVVAFALCLGLWIGNQLMHVSQYVARILR